MITARENLLMSMKRQGFQSVPLESGRFCPSQIEAFKKRFGHCDYESYFKNPFRFVGMPMIKTWTDANNIYLREQLPEKTYIDIWGVGHSHQENCFHMTRMHHPLAGDPSLDEVINYPLPAIGNDAPDRVEAKVKEIHSQGLAAMGEMACTVWEVAWYIRSMEDLMVDMMTDDERAFVHFDRITEHTIKRTELYAKAGVDIIQFGDDIGMQQTVMMSTDLWRKWIKPRFASIIEAGRRIKPDILVFYHSCGYVIPFIDELIEIGVDILNPVQPECMKLEEVHRLAKGRLSYWGSIGTQTTLPFGTTNEVKEEVWKNLSICGKQGGIVIAPTHIVEPEVPWENLLAMAEAAAEFRL